MAELYDTCFVCRGKISEGDHVIATDDVTCTKAEKDEFHEFEPWDANPYRGVYCPECWDSIMSLAFRSKTSGLDNVEAK